MSNFDPSSFVDITITEEFTRRPPLPVGDYTAIIGDITCVPWQGKADPAKSGLKYVVPLTIEVPPNVQSDLGLSIPTIKLTDGIMLDLTEAGTLDTSPGKNGALRRYRDALKMNKAGEPFSPRKMVGQPITVRIIHEVWNEQIQERVAGVAEVS